MSVNCPYCSTDVPQQSPPSDLANCPKCQRFLKCCVQCSTLNGAFGNFCRSCRTEHSAAKGNWLAYKGSGQRLGLNDSSFSSWEPARWENLEILEKGLSLQLGDTCRSLLGYDRHLVAVSQSGAVEVADPESSALVCRFKADGPVSCEPCIDRGILYLGSPWRLTAYSLGALTLATPRLSPLWQLPLSGTPVQALTVMGKHLYVTVYHQDGRKEVQVVENLERTPPSSARVLYVGSRLSWLAADPTRKQVVFFSEEEGGRQLHWVTQSSPAEITSRPLAVPPFVDPIPIVLLGGKVFGVFGDDEKLCRIDIKSATFEQALSSDAKLFSLNREGERDWEGDGVCIDTNGVVFLRSGIKDALAPLERVVKGSPVLLQGKVAVLGMQDGRIRFYDLNHPPRHEIRRLDRDGEPITALASFQNYVVAGNAKGIVKVFELRGKKLAA